MGAVYGVFDDYTLGFLLLASTALIAAASTATIVRQRAAR
jgi:hypothetical protein